LTATGLAVARDLARIGVRVIGIDADRWRPGQISADVTRVEGLSDQPVDDSLVAKLIDFAKRSALPPVVIPSADDAVEFLVRHRDELMPHMRISSGLTEDRGGMLVDKLRFAERCREMAIDTPLTSLPETRADIDAFVAAAGLPCIVKPRAGHKWRQKLQGAKLLVPQTRAELDHAIDDVVGEPGAVVLQELVPGPEREIVVGACLVGEDGTVRHVVTARKVRQFPLDFGSGALVVTEPLPEVARLSAEILEKLDYRGVCGTEFKLDPRNGRLRLIEINARPVLWYDLCRAAGSHLLEAHYAELAGLPAVSVAPQRQRVVWRYLTRDVIALVQRHKRPFAIARELAKTPRADTLATMDTNDPKTIAATISHTMAQAVSHLAKR